MPAQLMPAQLMPVQRMPVQRMPVLPEKGGGMEIGMKVISVLALLAKSSFYKILAVLLLMIPVEGILFLESLQNQQGLGSPEGAFAGSRISVVFLAALGLVFLLLIWTESRMDQSSQYTLRRLRITGRQLFTVKTVYNVLCLTLLFVLQIWLAIGMVWIYGRGTNPGYDSPQLLFLTFYRNNFLHSLLPMAEVGKWVCNILMILAFSMEAAGSGGKRNYTGAISMFILAASWFVSPIGFDATEIFWFIIYGAVITVAVLRVFGVVGGDRE